MSSSKFFDDAVFVLSSLVTDPSSLLIWQFGVMTVFFYKRLFGNLEIGNTPVWVLPDIWKLGHVRNKLVKIGKNLARISLIKSYWKCQGYMFYLFRFIEMKPRGIKLPPLPSTHPLRLNRIDNVTFLSWTAY